MLARSHWESDLYCLSPFKYPECPKSKKPIQTVAVMIKLKLHVLCVCKSMAWGSKLDVKYSKGSD